MTHTYSKSKPPIVMISTYPPRPCGIGIFCEEAREFIQKAHPNRDVLVISYTDGEGTGVFPIIDVGKPDWWRPVAQKIEELRPYVIHIEHEYSLYEYHDDQGRGDHNAGLLALLEAIRDWPTVVEPHTVHGRMKDAEAQFIHHLCERADIVLFKCHYQKWRLEFTFSSEYGWETPKNVMVVPHGVRQDRHGMSREIAMLRTELGQDNGLQPSDPIIGLVGWIQCNKRWDLLTSMWEDLAGEITQRTGQRWKLLAAGMMRDPSRHQKAYEQYKEEVKKLEQKGLAHYLEFVPRGEAYYRVIGACDVIVLPSIDETQSGTLARVIALNKPFITTAPLEGLTAQTLESGGGLLFTTKPMLREQVIRLTCDVDLRKKLSENLKWYRDKVVSWDVVTKQYSEAYELARTATHTGAKAILPLEF